MEKAKLILKRSLNYLFPLGILLFIFDMLNTYRWEKYNDTIINYSIAIVFLFIGCIMLAINLIDKKMGNVPIKVKKKC
ncbi:hypothetical protein [Rubeoparvulum massiliense]|uniref:hypothetical protein n=1 Tax=Rubeoparvulum massiliense TaxID=1631346 RepID=UPI00065E3955|nr:hypothetical protein [Rubeoparvulum massiliense]